jgi:mono/diheme cytochrome c family protein
MRKLFSPATIGVAGAVLLLGALRISSGHQDPAFLPIGQTARADDQPAMKPEELAEKAYLILDKSCGACHGDGKRLARRALISRTGYKTLVDEQHKVVPGKPDESELYLRMTNGQRPMPPGNFEPKPTAEEIALIKTWIEQGAPAWSQEAPAAPAPAGQ